MPSFADTIATTVGVLTISNLIGSFLFGIVIVQTYIFFTRYPNDTVRMKALVVILGIFELGHSVCFCGLLYVEAVSNYGNPKALSKIPIWGTLGFFFGAALDFTAEMFFVYRIRAFVKNVNSLPAYGLALITFTRFCFKIVIIVFSARASTLLEFLSEQRKPLISMLSICFVTDSAVSFTLLYYLTAFRGLRSKGLRSSGILPSEIIDGIITWTIKTGLVMATCNLALLICFLTMPDNYVWFSMYTFLPKLYSISVLSSLNGRTQVAIRTAQTTANSIEWRDPQTFQQGIATKDSLNDKQENNLNFKKVTGLTIDD